MTLKRKIATSMNYEERKGEKESLLPSKTIPDMAIPLEVLIDRYVRGIDLEERRDPYWQEDDVYIPEPKSLDLVDVEEMKLKLADRANQLEQDVATENLNNYKKRIKKQLEDEKDEETSED